MVLPVTFTMTSLSWIILGLNVSTRKTGSVGSSEVGKETGGWWLLTELYAVLAVPDKSLHFLS